MLWIFHFREDKDPLNNNANGLLNPSKVGSRKSGIGDLISPISVKMEKCGLKTNGEMTENLPEDKKNARMHLTKYELEGLRFLVHWLEQLPPTKKLVPKDITEPEQLLKDIKV